MKSVGKSWTSYFADDSHSYQNPPLTSTEIFFIVSFLALFSLIYLIYAQHHKILFYVMTRYVVSGFFYAAGIFSVLYMIIVDYDNKSQDEKDNKDNEAQQESSM
ncbi:unnamed protein product [Angiostrongylus costaricensis]|uniref:DUF1084 domain-containing protein n=1 Tax=Angiostrongylus costaricensis TaxID=334426 RepID=A0A0R3PUU7_ANGCS|nr:unnamed protein product [Angiostrongylus costaricensis]